MKNKHQYNGTLRETVFIFGICVSLLLTACSYIVRPTSESTLLPNVTEHSLPSASITETPFSLPTPIKESITQAPIFPAATVDSQATGQWQIVTKYGKEVNQIRALLIDSMGNLWAGGPDFLTQWNTITKEPTVYKLLGNKQINSVTALLEQNSKIWIGTDGAGIFVKDNTTWTTFGITEGLPNNHISSLVSTKDGKVWVDFSKFEKSVDDIYYFGYIDGKSWNKERGGGFLKITEGADDNIYGAGVSLLPGADMLATVGRFNQSTSKWEEIYHSTEWITALARGNDDTLWIAAEDIVYKYDGKVWTKIIPPWFGQRRKIIVSSIAIEPNETVWFGFSFTWSDMNLPCGLRSDAAVEYGVYRYTGETWTHFTKEDGLVDNKICAIVIAPDESVWFGSYDKGISRFDGKTWSSYVVP